MAASHANRVFGRTIRALRDERAISQEELGFRSGLDRSYVGDVERGQRNPSLVSIVRLAEGLDLAPSSVFERFERALEEEG